MSKRALALANKYGKKTDIIEIWQDIMEEKRCNGEILDLTDGAFNIPAYKSPYMAIITESEMLQPMRWGLISHVTKDRETVIEKDKKNWYKNARSETVFTTWPYKLSIGSQRCIIPSSGFFEWHENPDGTKSPYFIHLPDTEVFSIGGIWDKWTDPNTGEDIQSFVMITTHANELLSEIHNSGQNPFRMPLIIPESNIEKWLNSDLPNERIIDLLHPYTAKGMDAYEVDKNFKRLDQIFNPDIIKKIA